MKILAIDPGTERSALLIYDSINKSVSEHGIRGNETTLELIIGGTLPQPFVCAIEMIGSYGMRVGKSVFETCVWIGRFIQAVDNKYLIGTELIYRRDVKMHLCGSTRAKDSNVRQAIMDKYGSTRQEAIGTKKAQGPLYGISKDMWAALGVAITYAEAK